jgi:hypothetical protein
MNDYVDYVFRKPPKNIKEKGITKSIRIVKNWLRERNFDEE